MNILLSLFVTIVTSQVWNSCLSSISLSGATDTKTKLIDNTDNKLSHAERPETVPVLLGELWSDLWVYPSLRMDFKRKQGRRMRTLLESWVLGPLECEVRKSFRSGKKS